MKNFDILNESWVVVDPVKECEIRNIILTVLREAGLEVPQVLIDESEAYDYPHINYLPGETVVASMILSGNRLKDHKRITLKELMVSAEEIINNKNTNHEENNISTEAQDTIPGSTG